MRLDYYVAPDELPNWFSLVSINISLLTELSFAPCQDSHLHSNVRQFTRHFYHFR